MDNDFDRAVQKQLDAAMPWVGLYIAAASAVCTLATAADAVNGLRQKKLWFPCKYSSLNAASLTMLAVALKLPMDLNTVMIKSQTDAAAKFASIYFVYTTLINFMPSLGSMNDKEFLANVVGLAILVITVMGNLAIQFIQLRRFLNPVTIGLTIMSPSVLMLFSLVALVSLAVAVSAMKRDLKWMHEEKHNAMLKEEEGADMDENERRKIMKKYWVMAESCSPQFVLARSVICTSSSILCTFSYIVLFIFHIITGSIVKAPGDSPYGIYTQWIIYIQSIGIGIGACMATSRWFRIIVFRCSTNSQEYIIEDYWIQTLVDLRNSFAGLQIRPNRFRKYVHDLKWCVLTLCIGIQILIVFICKMHVFFSVFILRPFLSSFSHIIRQTGHTSGGDTDTDTDTDQNLNRYVLLLEGEAELPPRFVKSMCREADRMIEAGRRKQPSSLVNLLHKSVSFNGVGEFNGSQIPSLFSRDPPDCWTLPVVTLTSIAIALPNTALHKRKQLLSSVREGISLANIVEETLDTSAQLKNIREAARVTWVQVLLYSKWHQIDLKRAFLKCKSSEEVIQELSHKAEGIVMEFKRKVRENPVNWPLKVVAANSMYRICQTILVSSPGIEQTGEEMLERLSVTIADILAACLTNLPRAMIKMCHRNSIEKRERSVREALLLRGKTERVVELVRQQQRPCLDHHKAPYIEEWRALFQQCKENEVVSASTPSEQHVVININ